MSHTRLLFALVGAAAVLGSVAGAAFGAVRLLAAAMDGSEEPL